MLRAVPDWKLVQLVNSSFTSFGPKAMRGRSKFSTEATLMNDDSDDDDSDDDYSDDDCSDDAVDMMMMR